MTFTHLATVDDALEGRSFEAVYRDHYRDVYRYVVHPPGAVPPLDWIIDPFARDFGVGKLSYAAMALDALTP